MIGETAPLILLTGYIDADQHQPVLGPPGVAADDGLDQLGKRTGRAIGVYADARAWGTALTWC